MAYTALLSLSQILEQNLNQDQYPLPPPLEKQKLVSLHGDVGTMLKFLEDHSRNKAVKLLENRIIDAAYEAEDIIETQISSLHSSEIKSAVEKSKVWDLSTALKEVAFILKEMMKIENMGENIPSPDLPNPASDLSSLTLNGTNTIIGADDNLLLIKERIFQQSSQFKVIQIVGMGGIGKTTLARRIYEDLIPTLYFDRCAWIVVSQEYSYTELLVGVLQSIREPGDNLSDTSDAELKECIHKELFGRRYLIVLDDVWSEKTWDELNIIFPKDANGSCLLLTSRLSNVAIASSPPYTMNLLDEDQSWNLLKERVFGKGSCPSQLEQIGKKIAKECWGLPLTIIVVAGLLKEDPREEYWDSISGNIGSREPTISLHCSKVLSLSYDHLPLYLKPCFLNVTAFPEDYEINVNQLIRLWVAEGFIRPNGLKCLEDVAEEYLDDLVGRSLLLVSRRRHDDRIKTVRIHDILREFGKLKAQKERVHYCDYKGTVIHGKCRRLSIHAYQYMWFIRDVPDPTARSLMIFSSTPNNISFPVSNFRLLRILAAEVPLFGKSENLIHLKYLALQYNGCEIFDSMWKLRNLQTLIIYPSKKYYVERDEQRIPFEFWKMPSLRHLIVPERYYLDPPPEYETIEETNLKTLTIAAGLELTTQNIKMIANIRKLGLSYFVKNQQDWKKPHFSNLVHLQSMQEFKISITFCNLIPMNSKSEPVQLVFPPSLKKVSLTNIGCPDWENINTMLGSLPNLQVLKLSGFLTCDRVWNTIEGKFPRLKHLKFTGPLSLHVWDVEDASHFPNLETLSVYHLGCLREIPRSIGDIDTLKLIEMVQCCHSIITSARQIQEDQHEMGNHELQLTVK